MSREIRRVPSNWEHPLNRGTTNDYYQPCFDKTYKEACAEWKEGFYAWENGTHPDRIDHWIDWEYWDWAGGPPDDDRYYRPEFAEEPTWYQVYETVSEGTPTTPAFATAEELIDYLCTHGQDTGWNAGQPYSREEAERFVNNGSSVSFVMTGDGVLHDGVAAGV